MTKRKQSEIGTARAHRNAPHNQPFNVSPRFGKKSKAGKATGRKRRSGDEASA